MTQIAMKVNQANLVKSLKFSFTTKTTVLGELMQNSRRAGATHVVFEFDSKTHSLRVTDDGCGIESIETLLTVAESGWDADVVAQEHPFGIGFLSALFACNHITIVSKSGHLAANTDDILAFEPVTVSPVADWDGITSITMTGVELTFDHLDTLLKQLAHGFPIPVIFNGEHLVREHALDSGLRFIGTEMGAVYLSGVDTPDGLHSEFDVYLQGLPIYRSHAYGLRHRHIIHLDASRFYARLPDRDKLVDEADVIALVKVVLAQHIEKHFTALKTTMIAQDFVLFYEMMKYWRLLGLLNDVPAIPRQVLRVIDNYPVCDEEGYGNFMSMPDKPLTRSEIEEREVVEINDVIEEEGAARYLFAWQRNALVYSGGLDNGHWIQAMVRDLNAEAVTLDLINETHGAPFEGEWIWVTVRFCDAYRIQIGNDVVEMSSDAVYQGSEKGGAVFVPKADASGYVLKQISAYRNEHDEFQESAHEADMDAFTAFVIANTASDPADAMRRLLPGFSGCPSLFGKAFVINLDDTGKVASVTTG